MITTLDKFITAQELTEGGKLNVGDVIEIDRIIYSHWVLFVGDGQIVHVVGADSDIPSSHAFVKMCSLTEAAGDSLVRINNKLVRARENGLTSLPCDVTVRNATSIVGAQVPHNLMTANSEHYVTKWKYGVSWSDQAEAAYQGFSSSPKSDPIAAHNTMLVSLKSLLNSVPLVEDKDESESDMSMSIPSSLNSSRSSTSSQDLDSSQSSCKSQCSDVSRETTFEDLARLLLP